MCPKNSIGSLKNVIFGHFRFISGEISAEKNILEDFGSLLPARTVTVYIQEYNFSVCCPVTPQLNSLHNLIFDIELFSITSNRIGSMVVLHFFIVSFSFPAFCLDEKG